MKKTFITKTLLILLLSGTAESQSVNWKIIGDQPKNNSNFDKSGDSNQEGKPAPRSGELTWADNKEGLWVFGGTGFNADGQVGLFGDLWHYSPSTNSWKLINGEANQFQSVVQKDQRTPIGRKDGLTWTDQYGHLWLYGGKSGGDFFHMDDMWRFDIENKTWTKISGSEKQNVKPAVQDKEYLQGNTPGSRSGSSTWSDKDGNLWLFGGVSTSVTKIESEYYNDLWVFDTARKMWKLVSGNIIPNQPSDTTSTSEKDKRYWPSSRAQALSWYRAEDNSLWLYGGYGYGTSKDQKSGLSDLWAYEIASDRWVIRNENMKLDSQPVNFSFASDSPENSPGYRTGSSTWTDRNGFLYLMGGHNVFWQQARYIDESIWKFNPEKNMWSADGSDAAGIGEGTVFHSADGTLYLFGGKAFDKSNNQSYPVNSVWKMEK